MDYWFQVGLEICILLLFILILVILGLCAGAILASGTSSDDSDEA